MKFTRFCSAESLIGCILLPEKDEQATHLLLSVFKKPLAWLEQRYDRETLLDSINAITIAKQPLSPDIAWIFAIQGAFSYLDMPYNAGEWVRVGQDFEVALLKVGNGRFAVLEGEAMEWLRVRNQQRQKERIVRFLKQAVFYPYYLQEQLVREFAMLSRVKQLPFGKLLNWKDEDGSSKLALIYKGVIGIQFQWKRRLQLAQVTRGMFLTNRYIRDQVEELDAISLQPLQDGGDQLPRLRFVSRSEETVLLIFNLRLVSESPYNVNPQLRQNIKRQFEKYTRKLEEVIGFEEYNKLHRNKKSIKQELQRRRDKETIDIQLTEEMLQSNKKLSPILQTYSHIALSYLHLESTITLPQQPKQFSHTVFTAISTPRLLRSKTSPIVGNMQSPSNVMVHNTWVQEMIRKPKNLKSFSTLRSLSTLHAQRHIKNEQLQGELQQGKEPKFFVPNQFVKRKLRLKYQDMLSKVKNLDLSLGRRAEESVGERMKRLESYVQSKRIVKLSAMKGKHKLLRDKVNY